MFKLSDKTRRGVTLLIFLLLGPLLLIVVLGMIVLRHSTRTVEEWQSQLSQLVGTPVEIESVEFPAPGVVRFRQFRMIEAETGATLVCIPEWELIEIAGDAPVLINPVTLFGNLSIDTKQVSVDGQEQEFYESHIDRKPYKRKLFGSLNYMCLKLMGRHSYWQCEIPSAVCYDAVIAKGKKEVSAWLVRLPVPTIKSDAGEACIPVVLHIGKIDFLLTKQVNDLPVATVITKTQQKESSVTKASKQLLTFNNIIIESRSSQQETKWLSTFQRSRALGTLEDQFLEMTATNSATSFVLQLSAERKRPHYVDVQFSTGEMSIPISFISPCHSFFNGFGEQCMFQGDITVTNVAESLFGDTTMVQFKKAAFSQVSLKPLWGSVLAFEIDGSLERLDLTEAIFSMNKEKGNALQLKQASGRVINGSGRVYWPGFSRLVQATHLLITPADATPPQDDVLFSNSNFSFAINEKGIRLAPKILPAQNQRLPLLEINNHCCIWWPTDLHYIQYIELLAALASPVSPQVPLTQQTQRLLQMLPIESGLSAQGIAAMRSVPTIEERSTPTTSVSTGSVTAMPQIAVSAMQQSPSRQDVSNQGMSPHSTMTAMRQRTENTIQPYHSLPNDHTNNDSSLLVPQPIYTNNTLTTVTQPPLNPVPPVVNQIGTRPPPLFLNPPAASRATTSPTAGEGALQPTMTNQLRMTNGSVLQAWQQ